MYKSHRKGGVVSSLLSVIFEVRSVFSLRPLYFIRRYLPHASISHGQEEGAASSAGMMRSRSTFVGYKVYAQGHIVRRASFPVVSPKQWLEQIELCQAVGIVATTGMDVPSGLRARRVNDATKKLSHPSCSLEDKAIYSQGRNKSMLYSVENPSRTTIRVSCVYFAAVVENVICCGFPGG